MLPCPMATPHCLVAAKLAGTILNWQGLAGYSSAHHPCPTALGKYKQLKVHTGGSTNSLLPHRHFFKMLYMAAGISASDLSVYPGI